MTANGKETLKSAGLVRRWLEYKAFKPKAKAHKKERKGYNEGERDREKKNSFYLKVKIKHSRKAKEEITSEGNEEANKSSR